MVLIYLGTKINHIRPWIFLFGAKCSISIVWFNLSMKKKQQSWSELFLQAKGIQSKVKIRCSKQSISAPILWTNENEFTFSRCHRVSPEKNFQHLMIIISLNYFHVEWKIEHTKDKRSWNFETVCIWLFIFNCLSESQLRVLEKHSTLIGCIIFLEILLMIKSIFLELFKLNALNWKQKLC